MWGQTRRDRRTSGPSRFFLVAFLALSLTGLCVSTEKKSKKSVHSSGVSHEVPHEPVEECNLHCMNGGTLVVEHCLCACPSGFEGRHCQAKELTIQTAGLPENHWQSLNGQKFRFVGGLFQSVGLYPPGAPKTVRVWPEKGFQVENTGLAPTALTTGMGIQWEDDHKVLDDFEGAKHKGVIVALGIARAPSASRFRGSKYVRVAVVMQDKESDDGGMPSHSLSPKEATAVPEARIRGINFAKLDRLGKSTLDCSDVAPGPDTSCPGDCTRNEDHGVCNIETSQCMCMGSWSGCSCNDAERTIYKQTDVANLIDNYMKRSLGFGNAAAIKLVNDAVEVMEDPFASTPDQWTALTNIPGMTDEGAEHAIEVMDSIHGKDVGGGSVTGGWTGILEKIDAFEKLITRQKDRELYRIMKTYNMVANLLDACEGSLRTLKQAFPYRYTGVQNVMGDDLLPNYIHEFDGLVQAALLGTTVGPTHISTGNVASNDLGEAPKKEAAKAPENTELVSHEQAPENTATPKSGSANTSPKS